MEHLKKFAGVTLALALSVNASAAFVINEIDADTPGGDSDEFIELKGDPLESADGLILVHFNGVASGLPTSDKTIDLNGLTADANGYLLIGNPDVPNTDLSVDPPILRNKEQAIALYQDDASNFPDGSVGTTTNLLDLLVYECNPKADKDWSVFGDPDVINEGAPTGTVHFGISRIPDGTGDFMAAQPTPKAPNNRETAYNLSNFIMQRFNQSTALGQTVKSITLTNRGPIALTINSLDLATTSSPNFTIVNPPSLPVTLVWDEAITFEVAFQESDVSANKTYEGELIIGTDSATTPNITVSLDTELILATPAPSAGAVKVNEICYNPGQEDHNNDGSTTDQNDEYVELVNTTNAPILIEGWEQRCSDWDSPNFHSFIFPEGATIPANGFVTVFTAGTPTGFTPGTTFTYGIPRIRNNGAFVGIDDSTGVIDGVAYLNATTATPPAPGYTNISTSAAGGESMGRRPDGTGNWRVFDPEDVIETDRPSPNLTNNNLANVSAWSLY